MGRLWIIWAALTVTVGVVLARSLPTKESTTTASTAFLPGETTHGHHQIEMKCAACHEPGGEVDEQSCLDCHQADLKEARDTHPRTKFIDPTKAKLLKRIDATSCLTCHTEHVHERTHGAGITVPRDYCVKCHDTVAEDRPSHAGLTFDTCTNAGCHNFHDNRALTENFLRKHYGEPDLLEIPRRVLPEERERNPEKTLTANDHDAPEESATQDVIAEWAKSAHALGGVNCTACHVQKGKDATVKPSWSDAVALATCQTCHAAEAKGFLAGLHGLRLSVDLPAMQPGLARLPMHHEALHRDLNCNSCHTAHRDDVGFAAVDACLKCHDDGHSRAYVGSHHHDLWKAELAGTGPVGSGVSCATCHMPRVDTPSGFRVQHNQSATLEPSTKMIRSVCANCHGLSFTLNALADPALGETCYDGSPTVDVESLEMVKRWFESRGQTVGPRKR